MATVKKETVEVVSKELDEPQEEVMDEAAEELQTVSATDKLKVINVSNKKVCLTSGVLEPGNEGIATRAELGTLWQHLELAE